MECNCNNNNSNGGVIPWVRGNRLPLIICVYENVVTQEQVGDSTLTVNEMTRVPYTIQDNDTVTVIMKSGFRQVEMPFTTDGNKVMVTDNGELPTGAYTVEVTIERGDGARGRWQETRQVRIYENTSDAQLGEMYSIDADLFFYAKGDTGTGIADITNNPDNTLTITMTDGTTYTTEAVKGEKGDKGDTGERGVSIVSFDVTGQTDVSVIYTVTFSDDTTQDISVPKGPQGDTGLTGNGISTTTLNSDYTLTIAYTDGTTYTTPSIRGAQGAQGVSVIGFTQTGETATNTMYNLVFSDGRTQSVAIPKGVKGDKGDTGNTGPQGAQGPKGDTVTATDYTLYNVQGSDSQGAMSQDATTKAISAQTGYYTCGTAAGTAEKVVTVESGNVYKRTLGGHFKVKMTNKNTAASGVTLQIGSETAAALWYNGAAVSASNTWDAGEVISVYYDGTYYQASNSQGGGGDAEKIKYNNTQSGLVAENVQGALDEVDEKFVQLTEDVTVSASYNYGYGYVDTNGTLHDGYTSSTSPYRFSTLIPVHEGQVVSVSAKGNSSVSVLSAYTEENTTTASKVFLGTGARKEYVYEIPSGIAYIRLTWMYADISLPTINILTKSTVTVLQEETEKNAVRMNEIDESLDGVIDKSTYPSFTLGFGFVNTRGVLQSYSSSSQTAYRYTSLIPVTEGQVLDVRCFGSGSVLVIAAYSSSDTTNAIVSKSEIGNYSVKNYSYTVPSGIAFVRISNLTSSVSTISPKLTTKGVADKVDSLDDRVTALESSERKSISILFIGNSLTQDAVTYVPLLLKELAPNLNFNIYMWYCGGYTLSQQLAKFQSDSACEIFSICENSVSWINQNNTVKMSQILSTYKFDIVSLQDYFNYKTDADVTSFNSIVDYIEDHYAYPFKVVTLFHQPKRDIAETVFERTKIGNAVFLKETVAEDMISSGIAIYRAMQTSLDSLGDQGHLSPDGTHAQEGLPCMMQAYVTAIWILKQVGVQMSVNNSSSIVDNNNYASINVPGPNLGTGVVIGTTEQVRLSQKVAIKAFKEGEFIVNANLTEYTT